MKTERIRIIGVMLLLLAPGIVAGQEADPAADYSGLVDPLVGTHNMGHTFPGATVPFGMVQLSPDTRHLDMYDQDGKYTGQAYRYCSGYQYDDESIAGFSHTHFSGTGHSDLGDISLMPVRRSLPFDAEADFAASFSHESERAEPGYYRVRLQDTDIDVELTATTRVGMHRYTFNHDGPAQVVLDMMANIYDYEGKNVWTFLRVENDSLVTGYRLTTGWARTRTVYFALSFSRSFTTYGHRRFDATPYRGFYRRFDQENNFPEMAGREIRAHFDFDVTPGEQLLVKVALSPTSTAGALKNLEAELPDWDFDSVWAEAREQWNRELGRIEVETMSPEQRSVFYTALYHTMLGPIVYEDVDGSYRGLDQNIHSSDGFTNYTIFSLWDTYRALHPLLQLTQPQRNGDMIESMLAHFDQSVHPMLPVWSHYANENWCMIGYHAVPVVVDALLKGNRTVDLERALAACVATSGVDYFDGVGEYRKLGYVPDEVSGASVSMTLEMAYDDWCIARLAESAGRQDLVAEYDRRALAYQNVFDPTIGFTRPRLRDGSWREEFNTMATHGQGFIEGNAWNYSLYVPHDVPRLVEMMGGPEAFGRHLDELFTMELDDEHIAHTEDITRDGIIGNYVHGNEPGHHIAYLYNWTDRPWQTQARVRHILDTMYGAGVDGLCGNDDAGQMSAWYVFSALGFYPVCPGSVEYALGSPLVKAAELHLENGKTLQIRTKNQGPDNLYVQRVEVNGEVLDRRYVTHNELVAGGRILFVMGSRPAGYEE
jgi:predicted alpha-1,2-mannosidase